MSNDNLRNLQAFTDTVVLITKYKIPSCRRTGNLVSEQGNIAAGSVRQLIRG